MKIQLAHTAATTAWREGALVSIVSDTLLHIHLTHDAPHRLRQLQQAARQCFQMGLRQVQLIGEGWDLESQWTFYLGFHHSKQASYIDFAPLSEADDQKRQLWMASHYWIQSQVNAGPAELTPAALAQNTSDFLLATAPTDIKIETIEGDTLLSEGWVGLHSVGRGSVNPPVMLIVDFNPTGDEHAPVHTTLVGKGITFDSGGYDIKNPMAMAAMKCDMGGAATLVGAFAVAINSGLNQRCKLILCCAENMVSHNAYRPGDVLTYRNGVSVEILNTDAEGRVVLADGLLKAAEDQPEYIIDAATLTGSAILATGAEYTATFALDKTREQHALNLAEQLHEPMWPMPLETWHRDKVPSAFADTANSIAMPGGGPGACSNAAGFLSRFVPNEGKGWLHFDLANAYHDKDNALFAAGATAMSFRTIAALLQQ